MKRQNRRENSERNMRMQFRLTSPGAIISGADLEEVCRKFSEYFRRLADNEAAAKSSQSGQSDPPNPFESG
jgi:hypothetical protein